jgi:ornithine decarboxylase
MDILYENIPIYLPKNIEIKDKLIWCQTGAYTRSYASIYFNGFPSIPIYFV